MVKLFELYKKENNKEIYKPHPDYDIYILAIDTKTGNIQYKKILEYSIHYNLKMYRIKHKNNLFKEFWVSEDHSLIVYDILEQQYKKISPVDILEDNIRYCLVKYDFDRKNIRFIPCFEIEIEYDPNITSGGDFTVENYYTFSTFDGVFVQDTMAVFHPLSQEAQAEIKEKLITTHSGSTFNDSTKSLSQDIVLGLYVLTK